MSATGTNPLSALVASLVAWAKSEEAKIVAVATAFLPEIEQGVEVAVEELAAIAGNAVLAQAGAVLSGSEKFGTAVTSVVQTVESSGKSILISDAQTAVQNAYSVIQAVAKTAS